MSVWETSCGLSVFVGTCIYNTDVPQEISRVGRTVGGQRSLLQFDRRSSPRFSKAAVYIWMEVRFRLGEVIPDFRYRL